MLLLIVEGKESVSHAQGILSMRKWRRRVVEKQKIPPDFHPVASARFESLS